MYGFVPRLIAACSFPGAGGAFTVNNGAFSGTAVRNGAGDYTLTLVDNIDPANCVFLTGGRVAGFGNAKAVPAAGGGTINVLCYDAAGMAADNAVDLLIVAAKSY